MIIAPEANAPVLQGVPAPIQIRNALGVDAAISLREYILPYGDNIYRWQFLYLQEPLNIDNFPYSVTHGFMHTELGDVVIVTWPSGNQFLYIDIGEGNGHSRRYHEIWMPSAIGLSPLERVDVTSMGFTMMRHTERLTARRAENESRFGMTRQYTSANFYWYSRDDYSRWLPDMAQDLEYRLPWLIDVFGISLTRMVSVLYYNRDDYNTAYEFLGGAGGYYYGGHAALYSFSVTRPRGSTAISVGMSDLLVHELVHIFQFNIIGSGNRPPGWLMEGTATYFMEGFGEQFPNLIRRLDIPTLSYLENDDNIFGINSWTNYLWSASIVEFIVDTWGFEYVIELHRNPSFDNTLSISRTEFESQWNQWLRQNFTN